MCISRGNSHTFGVAAVGVNGFCMAILVPFGSSTSSMCIVRVNFRTFRCSSTLLNGL